MCHVCKIHMKGHYTLYIYMALTYDITHIVGIKNFLLARRTFYKRVLLFCVLHLFSHLQELKINHGRAARLEQQKNHSTRKHAYIKGDSFMVDALLVYGLYDRSHV